MGEEAGGAIADVGGECVVETSEIERGDVCVGDEDVCVCGERRCEGASDVVVEVKSTVNGVFAEDVDRMEGHG